MIAVSSSMTNAIRESLMNVDRNSAGLVPVKEMDHHYCSLNKIEGESVYLPLFTAGVDGKQVFIYLKMGCCSSNYDGE